MSSQACDTDCIGFGCGFPSISSRHIRFWDLVLLDQNIANAKIDHLAEVAKLKREALVKEEGKSVSNKDLSLPPDDHLLCFDTLYVHNAKVQPMT